LPGNLLRAFFISLLIHVFLFWPTNPAWREATPAASMIATLRPTTAVTGAAAISVPKTMLPPTPARTLETVRPKPLAIAVEHADNQSTPAFPLTAGAAARSENPTATLVSEEGANAEGLRGYRLALAREARRYKRYPTRAIDAGWSGTVELRVTVQTSGAAEAELVKSSDHGTLDEAALEMMRLALPATQVPSVLRGRTFVVNLPVVFELPE
jgi:protein TonB